jgi:FlaA1/EpsC-like NDP-sugar epimerase
MSNFETSGWNRFLPQPHDETGSFKFASANARRRVLVTGAGGYIGSALVRAIVGAGPTCMVLLDSSEHNLFEIQRRLEQEPHIALLGSADDPDLLNDIFNRFRPEIVYHAAAFKHVPLLERNPIAAVRNNAIGTYVLAQTCIRYGASQFVLISTDKAVNPHSILGVSKRIAELAVLSLSSPSCRMNAIRLGNVIGSGGSVVPVFLQQIAEGRPVTVTHPEVSRWFLSLRETVEAVLACGTAPCEGRILLPELGEPVGIADLARFQIQASARKIPIRFTGLRPGDKLTEELTFQSERNDGLVEGPLRVIQTRGLAPPDLEFVMEQLSGCVARRDSSGLIRTLCAVVPEYVPSRLVLDGMTYAAQVAQ